MDSKHDDRWDERGKHGECDERSERRWDKHSDAASDGLRGWLPTDEAAGGATLLPQSARQWTIGQAILAVLVAVLGGSVLDFSPSTVGFGRGSPWSHYPTHNSQPTSS